MKFMGGPRGSLWIHHHVTSLQRTPFWSWPTVIDVLRGKHVASAHIQSISAKGQRCGSSNAPVGHLQSNNANNEVLRQDESTSRDLCDATWKGRAPLIANWNFLLQHYTVESWWMEAFIRGQQSVFVALWCPHLLMGSCKLLWNGTKHHALRNDTLVEFQKAPFLWLWMGMCFVCRALINLSFLFPQHKAPVRHVLPCEGTRSQRSLWVSWRTWSKVQATRKYCVSCVSCVRCVSAFHSMTGITD